MNGKIAGVIIVLAAAGAAGWWFMRPAAPAEPVKAAAIAPKTEAPAPAPRPAAPVELPKPRIELPVAPPAPVPSQAPTQPAAERPSADPQAELTTMFPDILRRLQAGDFLALMQDYMPPGTFDNLPPEQRAEMEREMQRAATDPNMQREMQEMITVVQSLQNQTPSLNEAGDIATYQISDPSGRSTQSRPFRFKKINGRWYVGEGF